MRTYGSARGDRGNPVPYREDQESGDGIVSDQRLIGAHLPTMHPARRETAGRAVLRMPDALRGRRAAAVAGDVPELAGAMSSPTRWSSR